MPFHTHTFANGLRVIGETNLSARSVAVGFFVRTGARDESAELAGVSHFLEHMAFKGTPRRQAIDVNLDFDRIGASNNAYTNEETTVFFAAVLPEYLPQAVDILADILRPSLREEDFQVEKKVILEEISMYDDMPMWVAMEKAQQLHFGSHPLGNSVLGTAESITALTRDQMEAYFTQRYAASNILVSLGGKFDWDRSLELIDQACRNWTNGSVGRDHLVEAPGQGGEHLIPNSEVMQEYLLLMSSGPSAESPLRYAADLLAVAIGDELGSRLYWELVDPGLAESADMNFHEYQAAGLFFTGITCEPENLRENRAIVRRILEQVQSAGIDAAELQQAKSKFAARLVRRSERPMGRMQAIAASWLYTDTYLDVDAEVAAYDRVTLVDVRTVLDQYPLTRPTTIAFGPAKSL